jgi:hypothetical protein
MDSQLLRRIDELGVTVDSSQASARDEELVAAAKGGDDSACLKKDSSESRLKTPHSPSLPRSSRFDWSGGFDASNRSNRHHEKD